MDYKKTACIVWPVLGTDIPEAHVTIVFLGELVGKSRTFLSTVCGLSEIRHITPGEIYSTGTAIFGPPEAPVHVVELEEDGLDTVHYAILDGLNKYGVRNASSFPDFRPHVTYGAYLPEDIPDFFTLGYPELWWGGHKLPLNQLGI